jgi:thymidylate kinase
MVKVHIAIEGFDGSGKTTLAKDIANTLEFQYIEKPLSHILGKEDYKKVAKYINSTQDEIIRALFYSCGNFFAINNFEKIVTDRHILSNFFYNYSDKNSEIYEYLNKNLRKPDLTILLYCKNEIRKKRIIERNPDDKDILRVDLFDETDFKRMENFLKKNQYNYTVIDNSNLNRNETLKLSLEIIKNKTKILFDIK